MTPPVEPIIRMRECSRVGCAVMYATPHGIPNVPARFCSVYCHREDKPRTSQPRADLRRTQTAKRAKAISPASPAQRAAIKDRACVVCAAQPCDPAHLIDKGAAEDGEGDPRAVIPLCRMHHRMFDVGGLSILEYLEPHWRENLAYAVERYGLLRTLQRVTNTHWAPIESED